MNRREFLAAASVSMALPAVARGQPNQVLTVIPQADLAVLDPVWTTTYQTRDHGFLVFDTLFGIDAFYRAQPQMLEGATSEDDGRVWRLTLRPDLVFHDGNRVLARDCVASVRRWGARDSYGQALMAASDEILADDDKTIVFRMKRPFPLLPDALGKTPPSICAIMPERLASTDPYQPVTEMVGSGPYRYRADERVPGSRVVYERFAGYAPRQAGTPSGTAGPKVAHFDRIEWRIIPDGGTVAAALQRGEVKLTVRIADPTGFIATMRFNHLTPPFDNPAIRRAVVGAVTQADYMAGMVGTDPSMWQDRCGFFCPGSPMASDAGMAALTGPRDVAKVRGEIEAAGYRGERIVLLGPTDIASAKALADITGDMMRKLGLNVDYQAMEWASLVQRRTRRSRSIKVAGACTTPRGAAPIR